MSDDADDDCALCGGPCALRDEHDDPTVTAADVKRLEEIGVLRRVSAEEVAADALRQREAMRIRYGTSDPARAMEMIIVELAAAIQRRAGR